MDAKHPLMSQSPGEGKKSDTICFTRTTRHMPPYSTSRTKNGATSNAPQPPASEVALSVFDTKQTLYSALAGIVPAFYHTAISLVNYGML